MVTDTKQETKFVYYEYSQERERKPNKVIEHIETLGWVFKKRINPKHLQNTIGYIFTKYLASSKR